MHPIEKHFLLYSINIVLECILLIQWNIICVFYVVKETEYMEMSNAFFINLADIPEISHVFWKLCGFSGSQRDFT